MVNLKQIKIKTEDAEYIESIKIIREEPIHSVISRMLDKAKRFDKKYRSEEKYYP